MFLLKMDESNVLKLSQRQDKSQYRREREVFPVKSQSHSMTTSSKFVFSNCAKSYHLGPCCTFSIFYYRIKSKCLIPQVKFLWSRNLFFVTRQCDKGSVYPYFWIQTHSLQRKPLIKSVICTLVTRSQQTADMASSHPATNPCRMRKCRAN